MTIVSKPLCSEFTFATALLQISIRKQFRAGGMRGRLILVRVGTKAAIAFTTSGSRIIMFSIAGWSNLVSKSVPVISRGRFPIHCTQKPGIDCQLREISISLDFTEPDLRKGKRRFTRLESIRKFRKISPDLHFCPMEGSDLREV